MHQLKLWVFVLALSVPGVAEAARMFRLTYSTTVDATSGPSVSLDATITTDDGQFYGAQGRNGYLVTAVTGSRGTETLSFDPNNFGDEIFYPGDTGSAGNYYVDDSGLDIVGSSGTVYNFFRQPNFFAYQEFDGGTARILTDASLTPVGAATVPEPANWAMMTLGMGLAGGALRRSRRAASKALLSA